MTQQQARVLLNIPFGFAMCGKGLLTRLMGETWQFKNWVARDEISARKKESKKFAALAEFHEEDGSLIPDLEMMDLFSRTFKVYPRTNSDGMPRNPRQAREMMTYVAQKGVRLITLIHLRMTQEESMRRFMEKYNAPDRAGRKDACPDIHHRRLVLHQSEEKRTLEILRRNGVHVFEIDAMRPIQEKMLLVQRYLHLPEITDDQLRNIAMIEVEENDKKFQTV